MVVVAALDMASALGLEMSLQLLLSEQALARVNMCFCILGQSWRVSSNCRGKGGEVGRCQGVQSLCGQQELGHTGTWGAGGRRQGTGHWTPLLPIPPLPAHLTPCQCLSCSSGGKDKFKTSPSNN